MIAIGIGSGVSSSIELGQIASDPQHVFTVANFQALNSIKSQIQRIACKLPEAFKNISTKHRKILFKALFS